MYDCHTNLFILLVLILISILTLIENCSSQKTLPITRRKLSQVGTKLNCEMDTKIKNCSPDIDSRPRLTRYRNAVFMGSIFMRNCDLTSQLEVRMKWQLWNVEGGNDRPIKEIVDKISFLIEEDSLYYGIHKLKFYVDTIYRESKITSETYCFFEVVQVPIQAMILGGDYRVINYKSNIYFEVLTAIVPGRYAVNKLMTLSYQWWCNDTKTKRLCSFFRTSEPYRLIPGPLFLGSIHPSHDELRIVKNYNFVLRTEGYDKHNLTPILKSHQVHQLIAITDNPGANIGIRCLLNCGGEVFKSNIREIIHLEAKFNKSVLELHTTNDVHCSWFYLFGNNTMTEVPKDIISNDTKTSYTDLRIKKDSLQENQNYTFHVHIRTISLKGDKWLQKATIDIITSELPKHVKCTVNPPSGIIGVTQFDIFCTYKNIEKELTLIMYEFYNRNNQDENGSHRHLGFSMTGILENVILTRSDVYVRTTNLVGAFTEQNIPVTLQTSPSGLNITIRKIESEFNNKDLHDYIYRMNLISSYSDLVLNKSYMFLAMNIFLRNLDTKHVNDVTGAIMLQNVLSNVVCRMPSKTLKDFLESESITIIGKVMYHIALLMLEGTTNPINTSRFVTSGRLHDITNALLICSNLLLEIKENYNLLDSSVRIAIKRSSVMLVKALNYMLISTVSQQVNAISDFKLQLKYIELQVVEIRDDEQLTEAHNTSEHDNDILLMTPSPKIHIHVIYFKTNPYWWSNGDIINTDVKYAKLPKQSAKLAKLYCNKKLTWELQVHHFDYLTVSGEVNQPDPHSSPITNDFVIAVHRITFRIYSLSFINFTHIQNNVSLRVVVLQGQRPDYDHFTNDDQIMLKIITTESSMLTFRMEDKNVEFFYIGILPGKDEVKVNETTNYTFTIYSASCKTWMYEMWIATSKCLADSNSTRYQLSCNCPYISEIVGGSIYVPSHAFDPFSDCPLLVTGNDYPFIVVFLIIYGSVYLLLLIWTRKRDKNDRKNISIIVLEDNDPRDSYAYLIGVFTGMRIRAGTSSNVGIKLFGEEGISRTHVLSSLDHPNLKYNSDTWFLIFTRHHLGALTHLQLWIDYSGPRPNWYCSKILVVDIIANENDFFFIESWFGTTLKGIYLDTIRECATYSETNKVSRIISENLLYCFRENHFWASILLRHPRSLVTRTQRLTLVMSAFLVTILTCSLLFYAFSPKFEDFSSYTITKDIIIIGMIGSVMECAVSLYLWKRFYNSYILNESPSYLNTSTDCRDFYHLRRKISQTEHIPMWLPTFQSTIMKYIKPIKVIPLQDTENTLVGVEIDTKKINTNFLLCVGIMIICSHFVYIFSFHFQKVKTFVLYSSILFSLIHTLFIVSPIQIFILAGLLSVTKKRYYELVTYRIGLEHILYALKIKYNKNLQRFLVRLRKLEMYNPPTTFKLATLKSKNNEYVFFLGIYYTISCAILLGALIWFIHVFEVDTFFKANKILCREFGSNEMCETVYRYNIHNIMDFMDTLPNKILPTLFTKTWYNGYNKTLPQELFHHTGWLRDGTSRLIGPPRLRQIRVKPNVLYPCYVPEVMRNISSNCLNALSPESEDHINYGLGWSQSNLTDDLFDISPWKFTQPRRGLTEYLRAPSGNYFHTGGYIATLQRSLIETNAGLSSLMDTNWIDNKTRILVTEFITYNVNNEIFTATEIVAEVTTVGTTKVLFYFRSLTTSYYLKNVIIFSSAFFIFCVQFICLMNIVGVKKYLANFWNLLDCLVMIAFIVTAILYGNWVIRISAKKKDLRQHGKDIYFPIGLLMLYSIVIRDTIGVLFCLLLFRLLRIIRFNEDIRLYTRDLLKGRYEIFIACLFTAIFMFIQFRLIMFLVVAPPAYTLKDILIFKSQFKNNVRNKYHQPTGKVLAYLLAFTSQLGMFSFMLSQYHHYKKAQGTRKDDAQDDT